MTDEEANQEYRDFQHVPEPPRPRFRLWLSIGVASVASCVVAYWLTSWTFGDHRRLSRAVADARLGAYAEARAALVPLTGHALFGRAAGDGLGLTHALEGDLEAARLQFAEVGEGKVRFWPGSWFEIVRDLVERGEYDRAALLADQALGRSDAVGLHILRGMAADGTDQLPTARRELTYGLLRSVFEEVRRGKTLLVGGIFPDQEFLALYTNHVESLVRKEKSGLRSYLLDREAKPLFQVAVATGAATAIPAELRALVDPATPTVGLSPFFDRRDRCNVVTTTIDPGVQRAAFRALARHTGGIVVLDADGGILAAAARDDGPRRRQKVSAAQPVDPLRTLVPIASVAKVPTLIVALRHPEVMSGVFPFSCQGPIKIDGAPLHDWTRHGLLADEAEALAVSCNLTFATLALKLGREWIVDGFSPFGFSAAGAPLPTAVAIGLLPDASAGDRALAELAVGLEGPQATLPLAAGIGLAIASGGEWSEPHMVIRKASIGGTEYARPVPIRRRVATIQVAARVTEAMVRAVESPTGTARRARPEGLTVAAKTGTAGGERDGYQAIVVGFAPVDRPRYAFAVYIRNEGRADGSAAPVTRALLEGLLQLEAERSRNVGGLW